jgi:hypothetical protein
MEKIYTYQNTAQKIAGTLEQGLLKTVYFVVRRLLHLRVLIKNIVIKNVVMRIIRTDLKGIKAIYGKVVKHLQTNYLGLLQNLDNGVNQYLKEIIIPVYYVVQDVEMVKRLNFTQTILKDWRIIQNWFLMLITGEHFVLNAIERQTLGEMENPKYCDVIRKRYAKFIGKEEEWEKITPKVN